MVRIRPEVRQRWTLAQLNKWRETVRLMLKRTSHASEGAKLQVFIRHFPEA